MIQAADAGVGIEGKVRNIFYLIGLHRLTARNCPFSREEYCRFDFVLKAKYIFIYCGFIIAGRSPSVTCRGFLHQTISIFGEVVDVAWPKQV